MEYPLPPLGVFDQSKRVGCPKIYEVENKGTRDILGINLREQGYLYY